MDIIAVVLTNSWLSSSSSKQIKRNNCTTLSRCEIFTLCTLLKVYLEECGPVAVTVAAQSFFSGQDVLQDFLLCTSLTEQTCSLVPDRAACYQHSHLAPYSLSLPADRHKTKDSKSMKGKQLNLIVFYCLGFSSWYTTSWTCCLLFCLRVMLSCNIGVFQGFATRTVAKCVVQ